VHIFAAVTLPKFAQVLPCCHYSATVIEIAWAFSIFLEATANIPQVWMLVKTKATWGFLSTYMLMLGTYRGLYIANWIFRYNKDGHLDPVAILPAIVHVCWCRLVMISV
jgi:ER lumen protein retaining receptor